MAKNKSTLEKFLDPKKSKSSLSQEELNRRICEVAYGIYEKRNCACGSDLSDWFEAEKIVKKNVQSICD